MKNQFLNKKLVLLVLITFLSGLNWVFAKNFNGNRQVSFEDSTTTIVFKEISITVNRLIPYEKSVYKIDADTCFVSSDIFESVLGQSLIINYNHFDNLVIEMSYETSVVITDEGPHCDLVDWKHYQSSWQSLKKLSESKFTFNNYSLKAQKQFPKINIDDFKYFVKNNCGEEWFQLIMNNKSVDEGASSVGVSKVFLKLSGTVNGKFTTRIIVFYQDLGC